MDYNNLLKTINLLDKNYQVRTIGHSVLGRKILAVEKIVDSGFPTAIFVAAIHAREYITTDLVLKFLLDGLFGEISEFNVSIMPMLNPDGVELVFKGLKSVNDLTLREKLLEINRGCFDFSLWKANARGVDINNNFNANFNTNISSKIPASQGYAGDYFESELETKAAVKYIKEKNPFFVIAYHSKGEEIYYNFFQQGKNLKRDKLIAEKFSNSTGYLIKNVEKVSSGGLKDWCIDKLEIPAITIEVGNDNLKHPIERKYLNEIFQKNKMVAKDLFFAYNVFRKYS